MTVKERLYQLVEELPESEVAAAVRLLEELHASHGQPPSRPRTAEEAMEDLRARLAANGIEMTPANPSPDRWAEPIPDLPDVDLSGAVLEEREEALRRWD